MARLREALCVGHRRRAVPARHDAEEPVEERVMRWLYGRRTGTVQLIRTAPLPRMVLAHDRGSGTRRRGRDHTPAADHAAREQT